MFYPETKVYHDGSHYIAIPHSTNPHKRRTTSNEDYIEVEVKEDKVTYDDTESIDVESEMEDTVSDNSDSSPPEFEEEQLEEKTRPKRLLTKSDLFNELYADTKDMKRNKRFSYILKNMLRYFSTEESAKAFVIKKWEDKKRSLIAKKLRFLRKAYMNEFNYFVTFTYSDELHTADTFKRKLSMTLSNLQKRNGWRYMGVWEHSPKGRLHFHGVFFIPENGMVGELITKRDYSTKTHRMQATLQNTYFNNRFGRSDFEEIDKELLIQGNTMQYILKYIDKTDEKIVYSHGLPTYIMSDIEEKDVITRFGLEDKKLILFDNFDCWDEGCLVGEMSPEVKAQLRTSN